MAADWDNDTLQALDLKFAEKGIKPHARPFRAAMEILGPDFSISSFSKNLKFKAITDAYKALFPHASNTWPGAGVGLVASGDDVRRVILSVQFGSQAPLEIWRSLGFESMHALQAWCRNDHNIAVSVAYAFADLSDFRDGLKALSSPEDEAAELWRGATSHLADVSTVLPAATGVSSLVQSIHLIAELSLKAALRCAGVDPNRTHDLARLALELAKIKPHRDDVLIASSVRHFPPYVESRYKMPDLSRLDIVRLALAAQFIAGSSVRRFFTTDAAMAMERQGAGPRQLFV